MVNVACVQCGKEFRVTPSRFQATGRDSLTCTRACYDLHRLGGREPKADRSLGTETWRTYQRERVKAWRKKNPDRTRELGKVYNARDRARHGDKRNAEQLIRYHADVEKSRRVQRDNTAQRRRAVLEHYGLTCALCRESHYEFLTIDHELGGGTEHRVRMGIAGHAFYRWLIKSGFPAGFRTLCMSCNQITGRRPALQAEKWPRTYAYNARQKAKVFEFYGGKCACCGESRPEHLCIDHVNGGGSKDRKEHNRSGTPMHIWLVKSGFPPGYRVLCHNCNFALGHYGYCPHERERNGPFVAPQLQGIHVDLNLASNTAVEEHHGLCNLL